MTKSVYNRDWPKVRLQVRDRDKNLCQIKGPHCKTYGTEADHIIPAGEGGSWRDLRNLRWVCRGCHNGRKARILRMVDPPEDADPSRDW